MSALVVIACAEREPRLPAGVIADDSIPDVLSGTLSGPQAELVLESGATVAIQPLRGLEAGDQIRMVGRLRSAVKYFVPGAYSFARTDHAVSANETITIVGRTGSLWRYANRARTSLSRILDRGHGQPAARAALRAIVLGDQSALDSDVRRSFQASGTTHVFSVSGLHLAALTWLLFTVLRWLLPRPWAAGISAVFAAAFTMVTGAAPPTCRALMVSFVVLFAIATDRRLHVLRALLLAVVVLCVWSPTTLLDPSAQLSFAAVFALVLFAAKSIWRATLIASFATLPICAYHFQAVATVGVFANLLVIPMVEFAVLPLGVAAAVLQAQWLLDLAVRVTGWVVDVATLMGDAFPVVPVPPPNPLEWIAIMAAFVAWRLRRRALALVCVAVVLVSMHRTPQTTHNVDITFLDVGQGDAALLEFPGNVRWLIDSGTPEAGPDALLRFLRAKRIDHIDVAVISHAHPDHYGGLRALLGQIEVGALWVAPSKNQFVEPWRQVGTRIVHPVLDHPYPVGAARMTVLSPRYQKPEATRDPVLTENDNSLVLRLDFAGRRVLFSGDVEAEAEEILLEELEPATLRADVLKVPHHGSRTSSTLPFMDAVSPTLAIISAGRGHRFGLPNPDVVLRWLAHGSQVLQTDRDGAVFVHITPSGALRWSTFR